MTSPFNIAPAHTTHTGGKGEYLHDWYAYLEGYSSEFVNAVLDKYLAGAGHIIEPFAGVGTTPLTLALRGIDCSYTEVNPAMRKVISAKLTIAKLNSIEKSELSEKLNLLSSNISEHILDQNEDELLKSSYFSAFKDSVFFTQDVFFSILKTRSYIDKLYKKDSLLADSLEIAVMSSLVKCSLLKRAGDVRFKTKRELEKGLPDYFNSISNQLKIMALDCLRCPTSSGKAQLISTNAKDLTNKALLADGVITSPPYLNGTNYFRNTKLELWFTRFITSSECLRYFRDKVITSGINDVTKLKGNVIHPSIKELFDRLKEEAYDSRISRMVAGYFEEMSLVLAGLAKNTKKDAKICIDIGDSFYSGIYVPTHTILAEIAKEHSLSLLEEITLRKRKSKNGASLSQTLLIFNNDK
ncbi:hypothetical protein [Pseudoalteromonas sp. XMcav11-Q]|uniref:hypothetical protein n=1 Tax=Pseudoalteromonas sp. XMcav11-Q TaxID=3136665 RepID=UPI0032C4A065